MKATDDKPAIRSAGDVEALPDLEPRHTPAADRFDGEVWRGRVKVDDDWAHVAVRTVNGATGPMFYWHGKWRAVAESFGNEVMTAWARAAVEAERARLATELDASARHCAFLAGEIETARASEAEANKRFNFIDGERRHALDDVKRLADELAAERDAWVPVAKAAHDVITEVGEERFRTGRASSAQIRLKRAMKGVRVRALVGVLEAEPAPPEPRGCPIHATPIPGLYCSGCTASAKGGP